MRTRAPQSGFTLIEILVVLVILSIVLTASFLTLGDFGASRKATMSAEQFAAYMKWVSQRAVLEASTLGVQITPNGYQAYRLNEANQWVSLSQNALFRAQHFPQQVAVRLKNNHKHAPNTPDIIITPSGDMSPFTLYFGTSKNPANVALEGLYNGDVHVQKVKREA